MLVNVVGKSSRTGKFNCVRAIPRRTGIPGIPQLQTLIVLRVKACLFKIRSVF